MQSCQSPQDPAFTAEKAPQVHLGWAGHKSWTGPQSYPISPGGQSGGGQGLGEGEGDLSWLLEGKYD